MCRTGPGRIYWTRIGWVPQRPTIFTATLAENLSDSVVAPLFWFLVAGLPGAALYRLANTADAMWGYPGWHRR